MLMELVKPELRKRLQNKNDIMICEVVFFFYYYLWLSSSLLVYCDTISFMFIL